MSSESAPARVRVGSGARMPNHPAAVWVAFARQGAWKSWVIALQLGLLFLSTLACIQLARRPPDVVLVDANGKSTYLNPSVAGDELVRWLAERRQRPSDVTVGHFSRTFLERFLAVNSTTIDAEWAESLSMMVPELRARIEAEAKKQRLLETYRASQVRTEIAFDKLELVEQLETAVHVRAVVTRRKSPLFGSGAPTIDRLEVELFEQVAPRSPSTPDGLRVLNFSTKPLY